MFEASQVMTWGSVGALVTILVAVGALVFKGVTWVRGTISASATILHKRCEKLEQEHKEMREKFVRRDDLMSHIGSIESGMREQTELFRDALRDLKTEVRGTNDRIDTVLSQMAKKSV